MTTTITACRTLRAVLYGRVSSLVNEAGAKESRSVDDQLTNLRAWASREKVTVVGELRDDGISASRYARQKVRPDWQKAMELIAGGSVDLLVVWAISRATRDRAVWAALIAACIEHGVKLVVDGKMHDPSDPDDGFMLDISAALAFQGSARISKDAKRSVNARAARGAPHGRVPDGYCIEYDPSNGKPLRRIIDPVRGPIIREIADRLLAGESAYGIAADFNARGITSSTGKQWRGGNIVKRVQTPSLAGLRVHHGAVLDDVQAEWPPIITVEEHHRLMEVLNDPKRRSNKEGSRVKHLGTGIYLCGVCEAPVRLISGYRPNGTRRVRYACPESHCVMRAQELTDLKVESAMVEFLSRPDVMAELVAGDDSETREAQQEATRLRAELADLRAKVDAGKLSLDDLVYFRGQWEPKLRAAEAKARPKHIPTLVFDVAGPQAEARWRATPITGRRAIVKALVTVRIMPIGQKSNQFTPFDADAIEVTRKAIA